MTCLYTWKIDRSRTKGAANKKLKNHTKRKRKSPATLTPKALQILFLVPTLLIIICLKGISRACPC